MMAKRTRSADRPKLWGGIIQFLDRMYNVAYWMVQDPFQAEEIVERSYLRVSAKLRRGEVAYDTLCRAVIQVSTETLWCQPASAESGSEALDHRRPALVHEPHTVVGAGLLDLSPTIRAAVVLHDVDHLSVGNAAAILDWPVRRLRRAVHAGRSQVQKRFARSLPIRVVDRLQSSNQMGLRSPTPARSTPSRNRLVSRMRRRFWSKAERAERGNDKHRPSAVGVLPADGEDLARTAPRMGEDPLMRLIRLGIGRPNTSDWR